MIADKFRAWFIYFAISLTQSISKDGVGGEVEMGAGASLSHLLEEISGSCRKPPKYEKHSSGYTV